MAAWLSHHRSTGPKSFNPKSMSKATNHVISQQVSVMALYSALAEDLETTACFLDFHETG